MNNLFLALGGGGLVLTGALTFAAIAKPERPSLQPVTQTNNASFDDTLYRGAPGTPITDPRPTDDFLNPGGTGGSTGPRGTVYNSTYNERSSENRLSVPTNDPRRTPGPRPDLTQAGAPDVMPPIREDIGGGQLDPGAPDVMPPIREDIGDGRLDPDVMRDRAAAGDDREYREIQGRIDDMQR